MKFTDLFIQRPVLASVVSLLILVIGLRSITALELREFPEISNTVVTVSTVYPGASSELIQGFITTPLQQAIAEADGIDFIVARSTQGVSVIEVFMELNYDPNAAVAEIQAKVASQRGSLPAESEDPVIDSTTGRIRGPPPVPPRPRQFQLSSAAAATEPRRRRRRKKRPAAAPADLPGLERV